MNVLQDVCSHDLSRLKVSVQTQRLPLLASLSCQHWVSVCLPPNSEALTHYSPASHLLPHRPRVQIIIKLNQRFLETLL